MAFMGTLLVQTSWIYRVVNALSEDTRIQTQIIQELDSDWTIRTDGVLGMNGRLVIPDNPQLKELFDEAHRAKYTVHPGTTKMCKDLKRIFWWKNMREDVAEYDANCFTCQQVKAKHKKPADTLQFLSIPG